LWIKKVQPAWYDSVLSSIFWGHTMQFDANQRDAMQRNAVQCSTSECMLSTVTYHALSHWPNYATHDFEGLQSDTLVQDYYYYYNHYYYIIAGEALRQTDQKPGQRFTVKAIYLPNGSCIPGQRLRDLSKSARGRAALQATIEKVLFFTDLD
jgi:hypothetical protein